MKPNVERLNALLQARTDGVPFEDPLTPKPARNVALCMIAKNEAPVIGRALDSVRGFVSEIIVVDTGSDDGTQDVARAHGARVVEIPWTGSFADARNAYLKEATAEWILVLDADEVLDPGAPALLERAMETAEADGKICCYWLRELSHMAPPADAAAGLANAPLGIEHYICRFFPRAADLYYFGVIHEQIAHPEGPDRLEMRALTAIIHHYGYTPEELQRKNRNERNLPLLRRAVDENPGDPFALFNLGSQLNMAGRHKEAVDALRRSKQLDKSSVAPYAASRYVILADSLARCGKSNDAICELQAAMQAFPGMPDAPFHLGNLLVAQGLLESAEEAYSRAIALGRQPVPTYFGVSDSGSGTWKPRLQLGMTLARRERWDLALPWLKEAMQMAPRLPLAVLALGLCHFNLQDYSRALEVWNSVDLDAVATPEILCRVVEAWVRSGRLAQALAIADAAAVRFPENADALLCRARVLVEAGDGNAAIAAYERALEGHPDFVGYLELGEVAAQMRDVDTSIRAFEAAAALQPSRPEPHNNLGALAINAGDFTTARRYLGLALHHDPGYDPAACNLARVYILEDDARRAVGYLRRRYKLGHRSVSELVNAWAVHRAGLIEHGPVRHDPVPGILLAATAAIRADEPQSAVEWLAALELMGEAPEGVYPLRVAAEKACNDLDAALKASLRWIEACPGHLPAAQEAGEILMQMGRFSEAAHLLEAVLA